MLNDTKDIYLTQRAGLEGNYSYKKPVINLKHSPKLQFKGNAIIVGSHDILHSVSPDYCFEEQLDYMWCSVITSKALRTSISLHNVTFT